MKKMTVFLTFLVFGLLFFGSAESYQDSTEVVLVDKVQFAVIVVKQLPGDISRQVLSVDHSYYGQWEESLGENVFAEPGIDNRKVLKAGYAGQEDVYFPAYDWKSNRSIIFSFNIGGASLSSVYIPDPYIHGLSLDEEENVYVLAFNGYSPIYNLYKIKKQEKKVKLVGSFPMLVDFKFGSEMVGKHDTILSHLITILDTSNNLRMYRINKKLELVYQTRVPSAPKIQIVSANIHDGVEYVACDIRQYQFEKIRKK
ncbi:MAG TPA: hypothetical protein VK255_03865 [Patescibacteria group bacterium]|nr:hypothetical protein [Patescibacteria group bacterium]